MIPEFATKDALFKWLNTNKNLVMAQKKSTLKQADSFLFIGNDNLTITKVDVSLADADNIEVKSIINTTNLYDSHGDVHIDGLWNKSLSANKQRYLVKQHDFSFEGITSYNVKGVAKTYTWKELNYPQYKGTTQALEYISIIDKDDETKMFGRYIAGKVNQHSVGMQYVKMALAIDQKKYAGEKAVWDKYFNDIANKEDAEEAGYFWAITEAKDIEGSAVVRGSNFVTPTQSVSAKQVKSILQEEQVKSIPISMDEALSKFKLKF